MKIFIIIALIASPVLTQSAFAEAPDSVIVGGKNVGTDPDCKCQAPGSAAMSEAKVVSDERPTYHRGPPRYPLRPSPEERRAE